MFVIEQPLPATSAADSEAQVRSQWNAVYDAYNEVACLILGSMTSELHRQFENSSPYDMIKELKSMFEKQMKGCVEQLERLGYVLPQDLCVGLILNGLTSDFVGFVRNYNMHNMRKIIGEIHALLIEYEIFLPKKAETPQVMMIKSGKIQKTNKKSLKAKCKGKANGKGKDKQVYISKPKNPKPSAKEHPAKDDTYHHCKEVDNCHYAPSITRGVVSVYRLVENRFVQYFMDFGILVSKNNVLYFNVIPSNGIYEINMHNLVSNDNSIYNVSTKRAKHKLDSTYLWHCRLAHISRKRIEKLQQEGLLKLTDDESFDQCVSCLSGKMTRKSFPHRPKKVTDLLGIIHTNMCGPLRHVSRQGASYFITFTDDYSRYGYVYLLKHKHEVFKTFKVFKNEVENQLGKRIKALRSDRDSEYISQEFKDYLKACEIVQHLTHPYTPQYNGVSERRNRTLLDMVRSMMNLTNLSLSFWDYALESATRILNMVPTKKVDKTPYELWIPKGNEASWHWKRNFPIYLAELLQKKKQVGIASSSDNWHYAPSITRGVVSVHRLVENRFVQCFTDFGISVSKNNVLYFHVIPSNGIYEIDMHNLVSNDNSIYNLQQEGLLKSTDDESFDQCISCLSGKMTRKLFPHRPKNATGLLGIIHTNVCGPLRHVSRQGASYFITFTDDYSRYGYVYLLKHKHEVFETFKVFKNEVKNQLGKTIKALRSDRGGKYISQEFKDYLKACGIVQHLTHPYTPQHNGMLERRNRTLLDMVRSIMNLTTLPLSFWDYALESATRILNMVPTKKVDKTPYELWYEKIPNLSYLKVWGCEALVKRDTLDKLQQRSVKCIFIGYPKETMGYYFYFPPENKIVVASKIPIEVEGFEPPPEEVIPVRRSERTHQAPNCLCLNVEAEEHSLGDLNEPINYKAAMLDPESKRWLDAMNSKMQSMIDNMVWVLVDLPPNYKTVGSKWIFKKKSDMDGIVHTYKARLVANGYTQLYGVDYEETFSPVANIRAIRILISIAAFYEYEIWQNGCQNCLLKWLS
ncbi:retrotransposon protein, putative, ty1-copia subclass [Tanacetum coccineum]